MIVQWCCKGIAQLGEDAVRDILVTGPGIRCRGWLSLPEGEPFPYAQALRRLTERNLDLHVNDYGYRPPGSAQPFHDITPFISLSAGCVERDVLTHTNRTHRAWRTALDFATTDFTKRGNPRCAGWVFVCYVLVGANPAVTIPAVAEEIRELNHARAFSPWYQQGEVAAKINVPSTQIRCAVHYAPSDPPSWTKILWNRAFAHPAPLVNERRML